MERVITSPAGDPVTVATDTTFANLAGLKPRAWIMACKPTPARTALLRILWEGGEVVDPSGGATAVLADAVATRLGRNMDIRAVLNTPAMRVALVRDVNGRRTSRIRLAILPES